MNPLFNVVVICCLGFFYYPAQSQHFPGRCLTPDLREGECIIIRSCEPLLELLKKDRPPAPQTIDFLRKSQCGFEGKTPLVCCPKLDIYPSNPSLPDPEEEEEETNLNGGHNEGPVDVSDHPKLALLPDLCGPITEEKITVGNESNLFQLPWMALLGYNTRNGLQYRCGGSLINERYVLTAAHCVAYLKDMQLTEVRLGEHDLSKDIDCQGDKGCAPPVQDIEIEETVVHQNYDKLLLSNDIALVRLKDEAEMSAAVKPICLPVGLKQQDRTLEGEKVLVAGWGATEFGYSSPVLLQVDLPIVPLSRCAPIYNRSVPVTNHQLCAGGVGGKDSCSGDSGGPLQFVGAPHSGGLAYVQYGIVSFGPKQCGTRDRPGVYTRVGYYMDWILETIH